MLQKFIAQASGGFLQTLSVGLRIGCHIPPVRFQGDAPGRTEPADEDLVRIGRLPPQAVIVVSGRHLNL